MYLIFIDMFIFIMYFPGSSEVREFACNTGDQVRSLGQEDTLAMGMSTHSSILAWRIPWPEETGGLHTVRGMAKSTGHD